MKKEELNFIITRYKNSKPHITYFNKDWKKISLIEIQKTQLIK